MQGVFTQIMMFTRSEIDASPGGPSQVTLSGGGLGSGPTVEFVRTFAEGIDGDAIPLTPVADVDVGTLFDAGSTKYQTDGSKTAVNIVDGVNGTIVRQMEYRWTANRYLSVMFACKVPSGRTFPGGGTEALETGSSNCKFFWAGDAGDTYTNDWSVANQYNDMCMPTAKDLDVSSVEGNTTKSDAEFRRFDWDWGSEGDGWNLYDIAVDMGVDDASLQVDALSVNAFSSYREVSDTGGTGNPDRRLFNVFTFIGWAGNNDNTNSQLLGKNLLMHVGVNHMCRVYLGDAAVLYHCNNLVPCKIDTWTDTQVDFTPVDDITGMTHIYLRTAAGVWYITEIEDGSLTLGVGTINQPTTVWNSTTGLACGPNNAASFVRWEDASEWNATGNTCEIDVDLKFLSTVADNTHFFYGSSSRGELTIDTTQLYFKIGGLTGTIAHDFTQYDNSRIRLRLRVTGGTASMYINGAIETNIPTGSTSFSPSNPLRVTRLFRQDVTAEYLQNVVVYTMVFRDLSDASNSINFLFKEGRTDRAHCYHTPKQLLRGMGVGDLATSTVPVWYTDV